MKPWWAAFVLLAACGQGERNDTRLRVTVIGTPDGLARRLADGLTRPTLVARDAAGQTVAGFATSWRFVDDGHSLILRLKPAEWSDGKTLVAQDIVAAFRRADNRTNPAFANAGISETLAPIARVVELRLDDVSPYLLDWLAEPGLGITRPDKSSLAAYRETGPAESRLLKRRGDSTPDAQTAGITISTAPADAGIAAFIKGQTDIIMGDGLDGLGQARALAPAAALRIDPLFGVYGYRLNSLRGPLQSVAVRNALTMAIDRPGLTARYAIAVITPLERPLPGTGAALPWQGLDLAARQTEARQTLTGLGYTIATPLRLTLLIPGGADTRAIADRVAADWAAIGVKLAISTLDPEQFTSRYARADYDLALTEASLPMPDAVALLGRYRCGKGPWCNRDFDAALDKGDLAGAQALMMADSPLVPLVRPVRWALVANRVGGWIPNTSGIHPLGRLELDAK